MKSHEILFLRMSKLAFRARSIVPPQVLAQLIVALLKLLSQNSPGFELAYAGRGAIDGSVDSRLPGDVVESPGDF
jgi:hypothetical protein